MKLFATEHPLTTNCEISSAFFWSKSLVERDKTFERLRKHSPVSWHSPMDEGPLVPSDHGETGFWAVTRAADIQLVSHNDKIFSSALGGVLVRPQAPATGLLGKSILTMDPPEHNFHRSVLSASFTPKGVARLKGKIEERAEQIVDAVVGAGQIDFVDRVSSKLPMLTIADMVGVPESQISAFTKAGNDIVVASDPGLVPDGVSAQEFVHSAIVVLREIGIELVSYRRQNPADDIATALAQAKVEGRRLSNEEITSVMVLLSVAGNDTTRHTTSWTALSLCRNPDQRDWLCEDFGGRIGQAVEEFIRHATVVNMFARTATCDIELGGQQVTAGDKVAIFYCSGNRDESLFPDPHRFDLSRPRTNHVAFGGRGVHYCLGNVVAKAQLRAIFGQVLAKLPNLEITGDPETLQTPGFNAIRRLPANTH